MLKVELHDDKIKQKAMKSVSGISGIQLNNYLPPISVSLVSSFNKLAKLDKNSTFTST